MCRSPGYLPWYWSVEQGTQYTWEEHMDGVITTESQYNFANDHEKPERGSLTKQGRRLILRADHICPWIANWVGLKNYRYFFTKLLWTIILFLEWFAIFGYLIYNLVKNGFKVRVSTIGMLACALPIVLFFIFFMIVFCRHIKYLCRNTTTLQELRAEKNQDFTNPYDLGCCTNCSETLGPKACCLCWFIPIPIRRLNAGIYWRRNDAENPDPKFDYGAEVPRRKYKIYQDGDSSSDSHKEYSSSSDSDSNEMVESNNGFMQLQDINTTPKKAEEPPKSPIQNQINQQNSEKLQNEFYLPKPDNQQNKTPQKTPETPQKSLDQEYYIPKSDEKPKIETPKPERKQSMIGVNVDELLDDTEGTPSPSKKRPHKSPKMRRFDPERDSGKKVYKKVHVAHNANGTVIVSPRSSSVQRKGSPLKQMPSPPSSPKSPNRANRLPSPPTSPKSPARI